MTSLEVKPLTRQLFEDFHGKPPEHSVKGFAWLEDGEVFMVCCVTHGMTSTLLLFDSKRDMSSFRMRRLMIRAWGLVKTLFTSEVYSVVDDEKPTAKRLHEHLGFEPIDDELYVYRGA